jgi:hypothetical protein
MFLLAFGLMGTINGHSEWGIWNLVLRQIINMTTNCVRNIVKKYKHVRFKVLKATETKASVKAPSSSASLLLWFLAWLTPRCWRWRRYYAPKTRSFPELHGATSKRAVTFNYKYCHVLGFDYKTVYGLDKLDFMRHYTHWQET